MDVSTIITPIVSSITQFVSGIANGLVTAFQGVFLDETNALTPLGITCLVFIGLGLALMAVNWVLSLVKTHRS